MHIKDFEYDGQRLSDFGFVICSFAGGLGVEVSDIGQNITFNKTATSKGKYHSLTSSVYEDCLEFSMDVCKNPCVCGESIVSEEEFREISRWLNRPHFHRLCLLTTANELDLCYYDGSFNISKVTIGGVLYGARLSFVSNRPFGVGTERIETLTFDSKDDVATIRDRSDEIGYVIPSLKIVCGAAGDLTITNSLTGTSTCINNCAAGEEILIDGKTLSLTSSVLSHDVYNDFNYNYFKIGNKIKDRNNKISVSLPCTIEITYSPIIKNVPV